MKFSIEIDDDESINTIEYRVAEELARMIKSDVDIKRIKEKATKEFADKKDEELKSVRMQLNDWDKSSLLMDMQKYFDKNWIKQVSEKVVDNLRYNSDFIVAVSAEIIKTKFK